MQVATDALISCDCKYNARPILHGREKKTYSIQCRCDMEKRAYSLSSGDVKTSWLHQDVIKESEPTRRKLRPLCALYNPPNN